MQHRRGPQWIINKSLLDNNKVLWAPFYRWENWASDINWLAHSDFKIHTLRIPYNRCPPMGINKCPPGQYLLFLSTSILPSPPQINAESNKAVQSWWCHQVTKMEMEINQTLSHFSLCASQRIMQILESPSQKCTNTHTHTHTSSIFYLFS